MNRSAFEINGLECAYCHGVKHEKKVVLRVDRLCIPMGKVTVILGPSGSGKSTLIETLGLMNNTIDKGTITYNQDGNSLLISRQMWKHRQELTRIRNRHFAFVFQSDFLMPHYSAEENVLIGKLIRDSDNGKLDQTVDLRVLYRQMGLDYDEISRKSPSELSVGQKQRLSFIRAMVKESSVIFGDEPTGNLDEVNSGLLMDVLKRSIGPVTQKTAILVSHNIALSIAKADFIILLAPAGEMYEILSAHVFSKTADGWLNNESRVMSDQALAEKIKEVVNINQPVREYPGS